MIDDSVKYGDNLYFGKYSIVDNKTKIGNNVKIHSHVHISENVEIGDNCIIFPGVKIYRNTVIGDHCIIHSGTVIGSDGFGYIKFEGKHERLPQVGIVETAAEVDIGANSTIDRARMGQTYIGEGTKIDNLVQIAHNVKMQCEKKKMKKQEVIVLVENSASFGQQQNFD